MTFVITGGCCSDAACVAVCPVQCIRPRPGDPDFVSAEQLYIDPDSCIDCDACAPVCPVEAISADYDLDEADEVYLDINAAYFDEPVPTGSAPRAERWSLPEGLHGLTVAVVGTGPAACYLTGRVTEDPRVRVTMFERLPVPFGLVRSGVAPDHQATKQVARGFAGVLGRTNVDVFFNVTVGEHVTTDELLHHFDVVVWAGGADGDRRLGIPGEELPGSRSARDLVAWYNGHPSAGEDSFDLDTERVVIVGNGNVALDCARILGSPVDKLRRTDMADHALAALERSGVREVVVVGRRGADDAAFSFAELRALAEEADLVLTADQGDPGVAQEEAVLSTSPAGRHKRRIIERAARDSGLSDSRGVTLRFGLSPVEIRGDGKVESVTFERMAPGADDRWVGTGEHETIACGLILRAIGYRTLPTTGLPYDEHRGVITNERGRVVDAEGSQVAGLYCTGWAKRGATGVIGTNRGDAAETLDCLRDDLTAGTRTAPGRPDELLALLRDRIPDLAGLDAWQRIDRAEREAGRAAGRPRVKLLDLEPLRAASPA